MKYRIRFSGDSCSREFTPNIFVPLSIKYEVKRDSLIGYLTENDI